MRDAAGNLAEHAAGVVRLRLADHPADAKLSGPAIADIVDGVATFSLSLDKVAAGYALIAESTGLTSAESQLFAVEPGAPAALVFEAQPRQVVSNEPFEVQVRILDGAGNPIPHAVDEVTLRLGESPPAATLGGAAVPVAAVGGVATFSGLSLDKAGQGATLIASGSMGTAESLPLDVVAGSPAELAFLAQPQSAAADETLPPVRVELLDAAGNRIRDLPQTVLLAFETSPVLATHPEGASLRGDLQRETVEGVAIFDDLSVDLAAEGYRLIASSGSMTVESESFDIHPVKAARLAFVEVPTEIPSGVPFDVEVEIQDSEGNRVTAANDAVSLGVGVGDTSALFGELLVDATKGLARFEGIALTERGDFTLRAYANVMIPGESQAIEVVARPTALAFEVEPPSTLVAGEEFTVAVRILDELDDPMTDVEVEVTLGLADPSVGLHGVTTVTSVDGLATFRDLSVTEAGSSYALVAQADDLNGDTSGTFDVVGGDPAAMFWSFASPPPSSVGSLENFVALLVFEDTYGNFAGVDTGKVTLTLDSDRGDPAARLELLASGLLSRGQMMFIANIDRKGSYRLKVSHPGLPDLSSDLIVVEAGPPSRLVFTSFPEESVYLGKDFSVEVTVHDASGNLVDGATNEIALSLECDGTPVDFPSDIDPAHLVQNAVAGVATFTGLHLDDLLEDCQLVAASAPLALDASPLFDVVVEKMVVKGITFLRMWGGSFVRGCATNDMWGQSCTGNESRRTLPDFWMMETPVRTKDYEVCVLEGACEEAKQYSPKCHRYTRLLDHPINCVYYADARAFCEWVGGRLPTLIEWEYAAKSGRDVVFPWGDDPPTARHANFDNAIGLTSPVGSYPIGRSFWGLLDMAGNVGEWVFFTEDLGYKMGGNYSHPVSFLRTFNLDWQPYHMNAETGFRCMMPDAP